MAKRAAPPAISDGPNDSKRAKGADVEGQSKRWGQWSTSSQADLWRFAPHKYKTNICGFWQTGKCMRGDSCYFAHGEEELRMEGPKMKGKEKEEYHAGLRSAVVNLPILVQVAPLLLLVLRIQLRRLCVAF